MIRIADQVIGTIRRVDLSKLNMPVIAVYEHPIDYPDHYVGRVFDMGNPTNIVIVKDTLEAVQRDIRDNTKLIFFTRGADDEKQVIGVWM